MRKFTIIILFAIGFSGSIMAQTIQKSSAYFHPGDSVNASTWLELRDNPDANFYEIQNAFEAYWAGRIAERGKGYKIFRRWEEFMKPRVYPTGQRKLNDEEVVKQYYAFRDNYNAPQDVNKSAGGTWTSLGPNATPSGVWSGQPGGNGRVNCIEFNPLDYSIMYAGAPSGGLWRSNNSGANWYPVNDTFAVVGISDVAINYLDTSIMYIATGDGDAGDTYSVGILKSTNSGKSWHTTSLNLAVDQYIVIRKILMHPTDPDIMWAATNAGVLKTTDGWASFVNATGEGSVYDIELKPGDPSTVYAAGSSFYKSTDGGITCSTITLPSIPTSGFQRIAIGVSPANAAYVYLMTGRASDQGFGGFFRSTDSGASFTEIFNETSANHNLLGWQTNYSDAGGQAFYDLTIAVSPTNINTIFVGGVNLSKSTNGGTSWSMNAYWMNNQGYPYCHADHHALEWLPGSGTTLYDGNDGGVFVTTNTGTSWTDISNNLSIAQLWGMGISTTNPNVIQTGWQDNGMNYMSSASWTHNRGGDGCEALVTPGNDTRLFGSYPYGYFYYTTTGTFGSTSISPTGQGGGGEWVTPIIMDPNTTTTIYSGYANVYRNTNATPTASNWSQRGTVGGTGNIIKMALAPSASTTTMYVIKTSGVYKSTNLTAGTPTWTDITNGLPVGAASITNVAVDVSDPARAYVTFSGYEDGLKVYMTTDGGTTWDNISQNLPNIPFNAIALDNVSANHPVYVGADVGVYYKDDLSPNWILFSEGLPNVIIEELEIYYGATYGDHKLRAGTYGRGVWETDLYERPALPPVANFEGDVLYGCPGLTVNFTDLSDNVPLSWNWTFTGGSPATSTVKNPSVSYASAGTYQVSLTVTNAQGTDIETKTSYIEIGDVSAPLEQGFTSTTFAPEKWEISSVSGTNWKRDAAYGNGSSTRSALFENYWFSSGSTGDLISPSIDLTPLGASPSLLFNVAYRQYSSETDRLQVYVSTDCGATWSSAVYDKQGSTLATLAASTTYFRPASSSDWRQETISLASYAGQSVQIKFTGTSNYGNNLWLDDIQIINSTCLPGNAGTITGSTSVCQGETGVTYSITAVTGATNYIWTLPYGASITAGAGTTSITVGFSVDAYSGTISVTPENSCGYGSAASSIVYLSQLPSKPDTIVGLSEVCQGDNNVLFYVPEISNYLTNQNGYVWTLPVGVSIASGNNTDSVYLDFSTSAVSGDISVHGQNSCGNGEESPLFAITVNPVPDQPSAISGDTNPCEGSSQVYTVSNISGVTYTWVFPAGWTQTGGGTTNSVTVTVGTASGIVTVTPSNACGDGTAQTLVVVPQGMPSQPSIITGTVNPCIGSSEMYNVTNVSGVTYLWSFPAGWSQIAGGTTNSITATVGSGAGNITVTPSNTCGVGASRSLSVSPVDVPVQPSVISGATAPCVGASEGYSVTNVSGVTYSWTLPSGWSQTAGGATNSITATVGSGTGDIIVIPSNGCGTGVAQTLSVNPADVPSQPSSVSGVINPCVGASEIYSVTNVAGVSYTWSFPAGWTQTAGGTTNSVTATVGVGSGNITVTPSNSCGSGTDQVLAVIPENIPSQPAVISGAASPCIGASEIYSVTNVSGVLYSWTFPSGWIQTAGGTTNSVTVSVGSGSGTITVVPSNSCGTGTARTLTVVPDDVPLQPSSISGAITPCAGTSEGYSVTNVSGVTYTWSFPSGWSQTAGGTTNSVTATVGSSSGNISVTPSNTCGNGTSQILAVVPDDVPVQPSIISGATFPCVGTSEGYSVTNVNGVTYIWSFPSGWSQTAGGTTNSVTATVGSGSGNISVTPSNTCGNGSEQTLAVVPADVPLQPSSITGDPVPCIGTSETYSVTNVSGVSYSWVFPSGWTQTAGGSTNSVTVIVGSGSGNIIVTPSNTCGSGTAQALAVSPSMAPSITAAPVNSTIGVGGNTSFSVVASGAGLTYQWQVSADGGSTFSNILVAGSDPVYANWTTSTLNVNSVVSGNNNYQYRCIVSGICSPLTTSNAAVLTVNSSPAITTHPSDESVCTGDVVSFTVVASGSGLTYQWEVSVDAGATWNNILAAGSDPVYSNWTSSVLNLSGIIAANDGYMYRCIVDNGVPPAATSNTAMLSVITIPSQPSAISGETFPCTGNSEGYSVTSESGISYSWTFPSGWTQTAGGTSNNVTATVGSGAGNISVTPSNACGTGVSQILTVTTGNIPSQPSVISGEISPCVGNSEVYSVTNESGVTYIWTFPAGWIQTAGGTTNSVTATVGSGSGNITVTPLNTCGYGSAQTLAVTTSDVPAQPSVISGAASPCVGATEVYSVSNVSGVTYLWSFPSGWTQIAGATSNTVTVIVGSGSGNISVVPSSSCGTGTVRTFSVTPNDVPAQPSAISGIVSSCVGSSEVYSVTNVSGVSYFWTFPSGWTQTAGGTTNSVTATVGSGSGSITVTPTNTCGNGIAQVLSVSSVDVPSQPTGISGATAPCAGVSESYSVSIVSGVSYTWSFPAGWSQISGGTTNSVIATVGSGAGNITVVPSNGCGSGSAQTLAVVPSAVPLQPSVVSGATSPCIGTTESYSVTNVAGVIYYWTLPVGWVQTSGGNTNNITVTVGSGAGNITVTPQNGCGNGTARTLAVSPNDVPAQLPSISGLSSPCIGASENYNVVNVAGVSYTWTFPSGWSQTAGGTTNSVTVLVGTGSGNITVVPANLCGAGSAQTLGVVAGDIPAQPSVITGDTAPCDNASGIVYSVVNTSGVSYAWTVPGTWIIISGQGTSSITVNAGLSSGTVTVTPSNSCGNGIVQTLNVNPQSAVMPQISVSAMPDTAVCEGSVIDFSALTVNGGSVPVITWYLNSVIDGSGNTYQLSSPVNGDQVYAELQSSESCVTLSVVSSPVLNISVYPSPAAPVISQIGDTLYSNYSSGNQWYDLIGILTGETMSSYTPAVSGDYFVVYTDSNGCASAPSDTVNFIISGVDENGNSWKIYPNPSSNVFHVSLPYVSDEGVDVILTNLLGEIVMVRQYSSKRFDIDLSQYPAGVYQIIIRYNGVTINEKLVKE